MEKYPGVQPYDTFVMDINDKFDVGWTVHHCGNCRIKPTRYHSLFYCTSYRFNMFWALLCPSSGSSDYDVDYHIGRFVLGLL